MTLSLDQSALRAGGHNWAERRLFEVLGGWVASTPEPDIRLLLDRHSHHCAWRAEQWWDRLPVLADVDRDALCVAPSPSAPALADRLAGLDGTAARLAGAYRFALPRVWAAYGSHRRALGPDGAIADGSTIRSLDILQDDLARDWHEGESVLQEVLRSQADIRAAATALAGLEEQLAASSGTSSG